LEVKANVKRKNGILKKFFREVLFAKK